MHPREAHTGVRERACSDSKELSERKLKEIEEVARGWGKLLAREAYPEGPGRDVSLADMEDVVASPTVLHRILHMAGVVSSFDVVEMALAESLVKQIHKRVKGTEKFFNAGPSGEAILPLRAAILCDGARPDNWIRTRPISPFSPRCRSAPQTISA